MNSLISIHSYFVLNGAIALGYSLSRFILSLPSFRQTLLQGQRLTFARYSFLIAIVTFFLMPPLLATIPSTYHSNFQLEPLLKTASSAFLQHHRTVNDQLYQMGSASSSFSIHLLLIIIYFINKYY